MQVSVRLMALAWPLMLLQAQTAGPDPAGTLQNFAIARFQSSGSDLIQAMASDSAGNVYVAGTTSSRDLPTKNALQPVIGEAPLMRSLDRGQSWQKVGLPPVVPLEIAAHPADPRVLFIGGVDGVYRTLDGGQTWRRVINFAFSPVSPDDLLNIAVDPANPRQVYAVFLYSSSTGQFFYTSNNGELWQASTAPRTRSNSSSGARLLWVDPHGSGTVVLGMAMSRDHGVTWTTMAPLPNGETASFTAPDPHHPGWIYVASAAAAAAKHFYLSTDWGATWKEKANPSSYAMQNLVVDPDVPDRLYASAGGSVYISGDNGTSWRPSFTSAAGIYPGRLALLPRQCMGGTLLLVSYGGIASSPDFGSTFDAPQLTLVQNLATGPGCAAYALRSWTSDAFVAKLSPEGELLWSTFFGGMDRDASAAIVVGDDGSVYVAGTTASSDFLTTAPRAGRQGQQNVFATRFDAGGNLLYSVVLGGELMDAATALAVDSEGFAYIAGTTTSKLFPTTPGAFRTEAVAVTSAFAVKIAPHGRLVYGSYLPYRPSYRSPLLPDIPPVAPVAVAPEPGGTALIGGYGPTLSRLSADGSSLAAVAQMPGEIYGITTDRQGNVYVAGQTTAPPVGSRSCLYGFVYHQTAYVDPGDTFVFKLESGNLNPLYSTRLSGTCRTSPGAIQVGGSGEVSLGVWTYASFPQRNPVLMSFSGRAAVARLSADGGEVLFSTYLDVPKGPPAIALGEDESLYVGVNNSRGFGNAQHGAVLKIPVPSSSTMSVTSLTHAFTGDQVSVMPDTLLTITGQSLGPAWIDLGLNDPNPLPTRLGGVQVLFDGAPGELLQVAPDHVICLAPAAVKGKEWVSVQVVNESGQGSPFLARVESPLAGLLTRSFPNPPSSAADGDIRNADGTQNDAANPAAPGSTVTLFATGISASGQVALSWAPKPYVPNPLPSPGPVPSTGPVYGTADVIPGFIRDFYQIKFKIPDALGPGVDYLPPPGVVTRVEIRLRNIVGIYVK